MSAKISVCIPTYNQANYVEQAVRSAATQTLPPFEIIVSDDCSTDETLTVLEKLQQEIKQLTVIKQPVNSGIAKNTNICLRSAQGEYIVRLDSDDYLANEFCEILSNNLNKFPEAGYAHAAVQEVDKDGNYQKVRSLYRNAGYETNVQSLQASVKGYRVAANIIMFRKSALEKVSYTSGRPEYVEDYHLSVALAAAGYGNVYADKILSFYRVWTDTGKVRQKRKLAEITGLKRVFADVLEPAYSLRNWDKKILIETKEEFACNHAECLSWPVYNKQEKNELQSALFTLSSSPKVKLYTKLYLQGLGIPIQLEKKAIHFLKQSIKQIVRRFNRKSFITAQHPE